MRKSLTIAALVVAAVVVAAIAWNTYTATTAPTSQPGIDAIDDALRQIPEDGASNP